MLFRPEAFEPLTEEPWVEGRVRDAIRGRRGASPSALEQAARRGRGRYRSGQATSASRSTLPTA
jgi:hypothetical protein